MFEIVFAEKKFVWRYDNTTTTVNSLTVKFWLIFQLMLSGDLWATTLKLFFLSPFSPLFDADNLFHSCRLRTVTTYTNVTHTEQYD